MRRADSQPPLDADAYMQGRQLARFDTNWGWIMYFGCSLCRPDFTTREAAPCSKWQWPNRDTKWRHLKDDRVAVARVLVAFKFVFVQVRVSKPAIASIFCRHACPNWILQLKGAKEWDGIIELYKDKLAMLTAMFSILQTHPSPSTSQAQLILGHHLASGTVAQSVTAQQEEAFGQPPATATL